MLFYFFSLPSAAGFAASGVHRFWQQRRPLRRHQEGLLCAEARPVPGLEAPVVRCPPSTFSYLWCCWCCNFSSGGERADNFPATEAEKYRANDSLADERQVGRRAVDHIRASGVFLNLFSRKAEECWGDDISVIYWKLIRLFRNSWWWLELTCITTPARETAQSWALLPVWTGKGVGSSDIHRWLRWLCGN